MRPSAGEASPWHSRFPFPNSSFLAQLALPIWQYGRAWYSTLPLLVKERSTLSVVGSALPRNVPACRGRHGNRDRGDEQERHDDEGEDPLKGDNLVQELRNANGGSEDAEGEADGVIVVDDDVEAAKDEEGPDEDVAKDAGNQVVRVRHHDGTVPVNGNESPGQRRRDDGSVDEARVRVVAEVERGEVEEVEDDDDLGPGKVRADKEHDKGKVEEVVEDEVATDAGGGVRRLGRLGEEVTNVAGLQHEENDPVDGGDDRVHGEGRRVQVVLVPDALANREAIVGRVHRVVNRDDDGQGPGEEGEHLVSRHGGRGMRLALAEGIDFCEKKTQYKHMAMFTMMKTGETMLTYELASQPWWADVS